MPFYEILHGYPLNDAQRDEIADKITTLHSTTFTTPRLFVHVHFTDTNTKAAYVGGKRLRSNIIKAHVRHNSTRTRSSYATLCSSLNDIWDDMVKKQTIENTDVNLGTQLLHNVFGGRYPFSSSLRLRAIFILGDIVAGHELGVPLPEAGGDVEWLKQHAHEFWERRDAGDLIINELLADVEGRTEFKDALSEVRKEP